MKALLTLLVLCVPALSNAHPGHGAHLNEYPMESAALFSIEAGLASLVVAAAIIFVVKKYKSKY